MIKDILWVIKELIPVGKAMAKAIKKASNEHAKNKIKKAIISNNVDLINDIISD